MGKRNKGEALGDMLGGIMNKKLFGVKSKSPIVNEDDGDIDLELEFLKMDDKDPLEKYVRGGKK